MRRVASAMVLHFFVARLKAEAGKRTSELYLRFKADDGVDLSTSEPVLAAFSFPLGPESQPPKVPRATSALQKWS